MAAPDIDIVRDGTLAEGLDEPFRIGIRREGDWQTETSVVTFVVLNSDAEDDDYSRVQLEYSNGASVPSGNFDFNGDARRVVIPAGIQGVYIRYEAEDDDEYEGSEQFVFGLVSAVNGNIVESSQVFTIEDNDQPITIDMENASGVNEGGKLQFRITAGSEVSERVEVFYEVYSGASSVSSVQQTGSVFISAGDDSTLLVLDTLSDSDLDDETVRVRITKIQGSNAVIGDDTGRGTLNDTTVPSEPEPSPLPQLFIDDAGEVEEGRNADFTVRVVGTITEPVTVTVATYQGTANADGINTDYDGIGDPDTPEVTLTFNPGEPKSKTVSVFVTANDAHGEPDEVFELRVESVENADVSKGAGTATIIDAAPFEPDAGAGNGSDTVPTYPFPDLTIASPNQAYPSDVERGLALEALERLLLAATNPLEVTNDVTFGLENSYEAEADYIWQQLRQDPGAVLKGSMYTPQSIQLDGVYADIARHGDFAAVLKNLGVVGDTVGVVVKYNELAADGIDTADFELLGGEVQNTVASGAITSAITTGIVVAAGLTPFGWGAILIGAGTALAVGVVVDGIDPGSDFMTGIGSITNRPEDFNPFQLIQQALDTAGYEIFGHDYNGSGEYIGDSSTTVGGSVVTPDVEYNSAFNEQGELFWYLDNVEISDASFDAGDVIYASFQIENLFDGADFNIQYYLSEDDSVSAEDEEIGSEQIVNDLANGDLVPMGATFAVGDSFDGDYFLLAEVQSSINGTGALVQVPVTINGSNSSGGGSSSGGSNTNGSSSSGGTSGGATGTLTVPKVFEIGDPLYYFNPEPILEVGSTLFYEFNISIETDPDALYTIFASSDTVLDDGDINLHGSHHIPTINHQLKYIDGFATVNTVGHHYLLAGQVDSNGQPIGDFASIGEVTVLEELPGNWHYHANGGAVATSVDYFDWRFDGPYDGSEFIIGTSKRDDIVASSGDDVIDGMEGYDQVTFYDVSVDDLVVGFDQTLQVLYTYSDVTGLDTYSRIEAFWSTGQWRSWDTMLSRAQDDFFDVVQASDQSSPDPVDPPSPGELVFTMVHGDGNNVTATVPNCSCRN